MSCVLTLAIDELSQAHYEALRQRWFPVERNHIPAHITLFHTLPEEEGTLSALRDIASLQPRFTLISSGPRSIGSGVAFFFTSADAAALHTRLQRAFAGVLSAQDRQGFRPHIVVQNKVGREQARAALAVLQQSAEPRRVEAIGLHLWRYLGGPWLHLERLFFS